MSIQSLISGVMARILGKPDQQPARTGPPQTITFTVTREDIKKGLPGNAQECAAARAFARSVAALGGRRPIIGVDIAYAEFDDVRARYHNTALVKFVEDFDLYRPVRPTTFVVYRVN